MQQEEMLSLLGHLAGLLGSQLTKAQAAGFFSAVMTSHLSAKRAQIFLFNERGDPLRYPPDGESGASEGDVPIDLIEQAMASGEIVTSGHDFAIPLKIEPRPFAVIVIESIRKALDKRLLEAIGTMASGLLCCGEPPKV